MVEGMDLRIARRGSDIALNQIFIFFLIFSANAYKNVQFVV